MRIDALPLEPCDSSAGGLRLQDAIAIRAAATICRSLLCNFNFELPTFF